MIFPLTNYSSTRSRLRKRLWGLRFAYASTWHDIAVVLTQYKLEACIRKTSYLETTSKWIASRSLPPIPHSAIQYEFHPTERKDIAVARAMYVNVNRTELPRKSSANFLNFKLKISSKVFVWSVRLERVQNYIFCCANTQFKLTLKLTYRLQVDSLTSVQVEASN